MPFHSRTGYCWVAHRDAAARTAANILRAVKLGKCERAEKIMTHSQASWLKFCAQSNTLTKLERAIRDCFDRRYGSEFSHKSTQRSR